MKAMIIQQFGGPDALQLSEQPKPVPADNEVLIKVMCAGVNPVDWKIEEGLLRERIPHDLPLIPGWDAAGIVESTGAGVSEFAEGDAVYTYCRKPKVQHGAYAQYVTMTTSAVAPRPANLSFEEAAGIPLAGLTAWQSLFDHAKLARGQVVLVHAGAGGVGSHAIQFAKQVGATVLTTASPNHHDYVKDLGADTAIDYNSFDFVDATREEYPEGIDVVYDTVGGETQSRSYEVLKPGGTLVSIVQPPDTAEAERVGVNGCFCFVEPNGGQLRDIGTLLDQGAIQPPAVKVFPLEDAAKAQRKSKAGHVQGKLVLRVG